MVWTVCHLILPLIVERNRPVAVGGSGLRRTSARAGSEAVEATSGVGMGVSMVPSRGVESGAVRWGRRTGLVRGRMMRDDVECSASTLWAGSVECRPLVFVKERTEIGSRGVEMGAAQVQRLAALPVGKKAEVANLHEA